MMLPKINPTSVKKNTAKLPSLPKTSEESFNQLNATQEHIRKIKADINAAVDDLSLQRSILSRAANFWGKRPIWQKIGIGIVVFGGLIAVGFLTGLFGFIIAGLVGTVLYTLGSLLLSNHYKVSKRASENLKNRVLNLSNVLESTINAVKS